ncbi:MAG: hypothetical protein ABIH71_05275, partial [Candidatus Omnitrophota bacterium]
EIANMKFKVYAFGRSRALYTYLNNELLSVDEVAENDVAQVLLKGIKLKKGSNVVSFYGVDISDAKDGKLVSFAFSQNVELGRLVYTEKVCLPFSGLWNLKLYPVSGNSIDFSKKDVIINKILHTIPAKESNGRKIFEKTIDIDTDSFDLSINQEKDENYLVEISSGQLIESAQAPPRVEYKKINPTKYKLKISSSQPYFLTFSESYHPKWQAFIDGKRIENHFVVNGFANGWYIREDTGEYNIILRFTPQRYFEIGLIVSSIMLAAVLCLLGIAFAKSVKRFKNG